MAICSEQRCFCPLVETWQWALTHARTRVSLVCGLEAMSRARKACCRATCSTSAVLARSECSAVLKMTRLSREARRGGLVAVLPEFLEFALDLADLDRDALGEKRLFGGEDGGFGGHGIYLRSERPITQPRRRQGHVSSLYIDGHSACFCPGDEFAHRSDPHPRHRRHPDLPAHRGSLHREGLRGRPGPSTNCSSRRSRRPSPKSSSCPSRRS